MHPGQDFEVDRQLPPEAEDLVEDLGLGTLFAAMAGGDKFVLAVARAARPVAVARPRRDLVPPTCPGRLRRSPPVR